ncbi:DDE superfamily endonuclease [Kribbella orskensis]|uniref:DDE superfamily endonuclease n=1 Tax=Kribbella orskensis TaxID=2512216 RepID=A0ABY2BLX7_9ACTN|nr:DDE superfamily endonuclease [Kribbella sp. VKM Ac-2500]TCO24281.1 DDE superfamily endonuclease [Kribbella orskensis]
MGRIASQFVQVEPRRRAGLFLLGLLAGLPRVNCWTIAEHAGEASPDGMQHLLARAVWDADAVRDDLRTYVVDHLGDPGAVLVVDETGELKKGVHTVGVQRQYTGTAGRIENAQVGVYLVCAATGGHGRFDPPPCGVLRGLRPQAHQRVVPLDDFQPPGPPAPGSRAGRRT